MIRYIDSAMVVGSEYFFTGMPGFEPHDHDRVWLVDTDEFTVRTIRGMGDDYFLLKRKTKDELIADALDSGLPLVVGKFLVPEFCKAIGFSFDDLLRLAPLIDALDERHSYEKIIYNAYKSNGEMSLTEEQREAAYQEYLRTRSNREISCNAAPEGL